MDSINDHFHTAHSVPGFTLDTGNTMKRHSFSFTECSYLRWEKMVHRWYTNNDISIIVTNAMGAARESFGREAYNWARA